MTDYDVIVVGSGFGGSVAALRLTERVTGSACSRPGGGSSPTTSRRRAGMSGVISGRAA